MVVFSSFYVYIVRVVVTFIISVNSIGILIIKFLLPEDQAVTYDLTFHIMLIFMSVLAALIVFNLSKVTWNFKDHQLIVQSVRKKKIIKASRVLKVERFFFLFCKITYRENHIRKTFVFLPKFREFFPFHDFPQRIEEVMHQN